MTTYIYSSLNPSSQQIRVLHVQPAVDTASMVRCSLEVCDIEKDAIGYIPVSYVWGTEPETRSINLDGHPFRVKDNLHNLLLRLRKTDSIARIWVDAICINQADLSERSQQVTLMGDIYGLADSVVVWLGLGSKESKLAIALIKYWAREFDIPQDQSAASEFVAAYPSAFEEEAWRALAELVENQWWRRMWTFQEYVRARKVTFLCGDDEFLDEDLQYASRKWDRMQSGHLLDLELKHYMQLTSINMVNYHSRSAYRVYYSTPDIYRTFWDGPPMDLINLLRHTHYCASGDPRDKLYALLGADPAKNIRIVPNYKLSWNDVYRDFVNKCITTTGSLEILECAGIGTCSTDNSTIQQSWVPDLRASAKWPSPMHDMGFRAGGGTAAQVNFVESKGILSCTGYLIDDLTQVFANSRWPQVRWWEYVLDKKDEDCMGTPMLQAFFRTMILDTSYWNGSEYVTRSKFDPDDLYEHALGFMYNHGVLAVKKLLEEPENGKRILQEILSRKLSEYAMYFAVTLNSVSNSSTWTSDETVLETFLRTSGSISQLEWPFQKFREELKPGELEHFGRSYLLKVSQNTINRAFFTTSKGFIGLGPTGAAHGDQLCILKGSNLPFILRPDPDGTCYRVVGTCYAFGLMHGQALQDPKQGSLLEKQFSFK